jgi:2-C-methyl-D-erythritol 2,4-cyclodiphosphate synthase
MRIESPDLSLHPRFRIGIGFDAHELRRGRPLVIGGVRIRSEIGLLGHSDADVLLHAVTDALLGALALPDIGTLFPDTDPAWRDADSAKLLLHAYRRVRARGYKVANLDCVVICDRPKIAPHAPAIRGRIAGLLGTAIGCVGLQAKTTEGTRLALRQKSIAALTTVLLARS